MDSEKLNSLSSSLAVLISTHILVFIKEESLSDLNLTANQLLELSDALSSKTGDFVDRNLIQSKEFNNLLMEFNAELLELHKLNNEQALVLAKVKSDAAEAAIILAASVEEDGKKKHFGFKSMLSSLTRSRPSKPLGRSNTVPEIILICRRYRKQKYLL